MRPYMFELTNATMGGSDSDVDKDPTNDYTKTVNEDEVEDCNDKADW